MATNRPPDPGDALLRAAAGATTDEVGFEKREAIKRHLDSKWTHAKQCPICGEDDWLIDNVANVPVRPTSFLETGERVYPLAPVVCRVCGYTFFVNEKWAGSSGGPR